MFDVVQARLHFGELFHEKVSLGLQFRYPALPPIPRPAVELFVETPSALSADSFPDEVWPVLATAFLSNLKKN